MKRLLICLGASLFLCLPYGCGRDKAVCDTRALSDSAISLMQAGLMHRDSGKLRAALHLYDRLIEADTAGWHRYLYYHRKAVILTSMGEEDDALKNEEVGIGYLAEDNLNRLKYFCIKYLKESNADSLAFYSNRIVEVCDSHLKDSFNADYAVSRVEAMLLQGHEEAARQYLEQAVRQHGDEAVLSLLLDKWEQYKNIYKENDMNTAIFKYTR